MNLIGQELVLVLRHLRDEGLKKLQVAKRLGIDRGTVAKYWDGPPLPAGVPRYRRRSGPASRPRWIGGTLAPSWSTAPG